MVTEKGDKNVTYAVNDFYSVYYIYMNVIRALGLEQRLRDRDIEKVISTSIDSLKKNNVVQLQVDRFRGPETLRVTLRPDITPKGEQLILFLLSNFDAKTGKIVSGDAMKEAYATYFYIKGDLLVKYQYIDKPKSKQELNRLSANNLADYYLLDADPGNDRRGMDLLLKSIGKGTVWADKTAQYATLSEYYLLQGKTGKAKKSLDQARAAVKKVKDKKVRQNLTVLQGYADDLYRYYRAYAKHR